MTKTSPNPTLTLMGKVQAYARRVGKLSSSIKRRHNGVGTRHAWQRVPIAKNNPST